MNLRERFVVYVLLSLLFSIMTGGAAGILMLWGHYIYSVYDHEKRMQKYRRYKVLEEIARRKGVPVFVNGGYNPELFRG